MKAIDQVESQRTCEDISYNISQPGEKNAKAKANLGKFEDV